MLYEILKTAKLGTAAAPDMFTSLLAQKMKFAKGGGEIAELSGVPPLSFRANGEPLLDWHITGAAQGVGEKTKNLLEMQAVTRTRSGITFTINDDKSVTVTGTATGLSYSILMGGGARDNNLNNYATPIFKAGDSLIFTTDSSVSLQARYTDGTYYNRNIPNNQVITLTKDVGLIYVQVASGETTDYTIYPMIRLSTVSSTDYEPYGYKIPVTCGGVTTDIYIGDSPLYDGDTISMTDTGIVIPTVRGNNTLTVDTTVQPSEVYIKYKK